MKIEVGKFCVYVHKKDGEILYIGAGNSERPFLIQGRNQKWHEIVGKDNYEVQILNWFDNREQALERESALIERFRPKCNIQLATLLGELFKEKIEVNCAKCEKRLFRSPKFKIFKCHPKCAV